VAKSTLIKGIPAFERPLMGSLRSTHPSHSAGDALARHVLEAYGGWAKAAPARCINRSIETVFTHRQLDRPVNIKPSDDSITSSRAMTA